MKTHRRAGYRKSKIDGVPDDTTLARCEAAIYLGEDTQRLKDEA